MAGGGAVAAAQGGRSELYQGRTTMVVILTVIIASCGGAMFGYDIGITGGVVSMPSWQMKFFPDVYNRQGTTTPYCKMNDQLLQLFTSSLYLAGMVSSLFASWSTKRFGRKVMMIVASFLYIVGTVLQTAAQDLAMLIIGRVILGFGIGFANQAVPVFLSEVAPYKIRGACNLAFQMACTIAIFVAGLINWKTADYSQTDGEQGWRVSLGAALVPGMILFVGCFFVPDTPNSLVERGQLEEARAVLESIRGVKDVDIEFEDIVAAARAAAVVSTNQWATIIKPKYRPQLVVCILIPVLQQLTGINSIMFYAPQVFEAIGHDSNAALVNTVVIGSVNVVATIIAIIMVDRLGRRFIFMEGGVQMFITLIITGALLGYGFNAHPDGNIPAGLAKGVLAAICIYVAGFAWSWGPLGWLVPSEIQPMETRSAGMSVAVFCNFLLTFVIGQAFLSMLCGMEWGVFLFFAGFVLLMTAFTALFLPETNGVPIEEVQAKFYAHWYWRRVMGEPEVDCIVKGMDSEDLKQIDLKSAEMQAVV